jgi:hypothetical protein
MKLLAALLRSHVKSILAFVLITILYLFARLPELPAAERAALASHHSFARLALPALDKYPKKTIRTVHPSLNGISAWISSVGASIALNDLDGDGLPNDVCYVDTRTDTVIVAPAPGTPSRYGPFILEASPLPYDRKTMAPMGCLPGDFNEDGLMDILVYYWGRTPVAFLRARPASDDPLPLSDDLYVRCEVYSEVERWYTNAATQADLDGDGHIDLVMGNYFPDGARILDADANGREQMQLSMSRAGNGGCNRLLLWSGATSGAKPSVRFSNDTSALSEDVACGWTLAVGASDLDGDLLPEVYFARDFGPDRLLYNRSQPGKLRFEVLEGEKKITTPASKVLGRDSFKGMGVDFGDLNGDALPDILVSNIAAEFALEESHFAWVNNGKLSRMKDGIAPFDDESESLGLSRSGWGWDIRLGDFDNDGVLEVIQATGFLKGSVTRWPELHELAMGNDQLLRNPLNWPRFHPGDGLDSEGHVTYFVRSASGRYYDLAADVGLNDIVVSRGIATADIDGDGRLDFAVAGQWDSSWLLRNEGEKVGAFLGLRLLLPVRQESSDKPAFSIGRSANVRASRPAIGASATVFLPNGRKLISQVDGGNGHSGKRSPDLHFGLGEIRDDTLLKVDLRWRGADGQVSSKTIYLTPGWHTVLLGQ